MSTPEVKPLVFGHLDECAEIFAAAGPDEPHDQRWTHDAARDRLKEALDAPKSLGLICASRDGGILGFALGFARRQVDGRTFVLDALCVRPEARRRGLATRLLDGLHGVLGGRGVGRVVVETQMNAPAEAFYRKCGYAEVSGTAMVRQLSVREDQATGTGERTISGAGVALEPIGFVRTDAEKVPRSFRVSEVEGTLEIDDAYREALADIEPGQRIVVIFAFHESPAFAPRFLRQTPPHRREHPSQSDRSVGVFSICSPVRPNPVGMSILDVLGVDGTNLRVRGLDMKDGTPILDIKPWLGDARDRA